jgi:hypothetical protein
MVLIRSNARAASVRSLLVISFLFLYHLQVWRMHASALLGCQLVTVINIPYHPQNRHNHQDIPNF